MGDIFFFIKMVVFTIFFVFVLQVKVGPQTLEERVIDWTHKSEFSHVLQDVADGAVRIIGVTYNKLRGDINTRFSNMHSDKQIPGSRIQSTIDNSREYLEKKFSGEGVPAQNQQENNSGTP